MSVQGVMTVCLMSCIHFLHHVKMGKKGGEKFLLFILITVISMKGDKKRTPTQFKKGHMAWNTGKPMSSEDSSEDSGNSSSLPEPTTKLWILIRSSLPVCF